VVASCNIVHNDLCVLICGDAARLGAIRFANARARHACAPLVVWLSIRSCRSMSFSLCTCTGLACMISAFTRLISTVKMVRRVRYQRHELQPQRSEAMEILPLRQCAHELYCFLSVAR
jgi:hypothetical protein